MNNTRTVSDLVMLLYRNFNPHDFVYGELAVVRQKYSGRDNLPFLAIPPVDSPEMSMRAVEEFGTEDQPTDKPPNRKDPFPGGWWCDNADLSSKCHFYAWDRKSLCGEGIITPQSMHCLTDASASSGTANSCKRCVELR